MSVIVSRIIIIAFALFLSACTNYHFSSNIDKENFDEYFRPSQVVIYKKDDLLSMEYAVLGSVEGSSCQEDEIDMPADSKIARTNARINAYEMNANGIVFQSCINFPRDETCVTNVICYGRALDVTPANHD